MKKGRGWILGYTLTIFAALALVHYGSKAVTAVSEQIPMPRQHRIVIDPGHGGVDGGAASCTGRMESSYNLEISLKLRDLLEFLGYHTIMVRTLDESIYSEGNTIREKKISDLKNRVKIVNQTDRAILLSIHQNQYPDHRYYGAQVFFSHTPGSKELAGILQHALAVHLRPSTRRKEKDCKGVYLMDHIKHTGILLECGFISNQSEEKRLADPDYQKKLCCVIVCSLNDFLC